MIRQSKVCAILTIGIWNGAKTVRASKTLYSQLLESALGHGLAGGTAWGSVEGSESTRAFRTIESEVTSNELPVWLEFVDAIGKIDEWIPSARTLLSKSGVIAVERGLLPGQAQPQDQWREGNGEKNMPSGHEAVKYPEFVHGADEGLQIQIFTLEQNTVHGKPLYQAVAEVLRRHDVLWVSTTRGLSGFGAHRQIHRAHWFGKNDVPIIMTVLDRTVKLDACLPEIIDLIGDRAFVVSKPVTWHHP